MTTHTSARRWKHYGTASLVAAGLISGGALLGAPAASATDATPGTSPSASSSTVPATTTAPKAHKTHSEHAKSAKLTGAVAAKVKAAALAKYPGATVHRVDTDRHGVYEAHLVTTAGVRVTVKVDKSFVVISVHEAAGHVAAHDKSAKSAPAPTTKP